MQLATSFSVHPIMHENCADGLSRGVRKVALRQQRPGTPLERLSPQIPDCLFSVQIKRKGGWQGESCQPTRGALFESIIALYGKSYFNVLTYSATALACASSSPLIGFECTLFPLLPLVRYFTSASTLMEAPLTAGMFAAGLPSPFSPWHAEHLDLKSWAPSISSADQRERC